MSLSKAFESIDGAKLFYQEWTNEIRKNIHQNQLFELDVKNGNDCWIQLCKALNINQIPQEPFPHSNDGVTFRRRIWMKIIFRVIQIVAYFLLMLTVVLAIK